MDIKHYYMESGHGDPIILLHGNGESCEYFQGQMEAFAQRFHVYAIDTRGHGKTPRGDRPFTIRQFADDLLGFMDDHYLEKTHLLGFSDGGTKDMIRESHTRLISECIPNSKLVFINGNHFIANKNPEEFNRVVLDFLMG